MGDFVSFLETLLDVFHRSPVLSLGLLLLCGYLLGKLFEKIRLPAITGYILAGLLLGESIAGVIDESARQSMGSITQVALGVIALTIGGEFSFFKLKQTGVKILILTLFEALFAFAAVSGFLTLAGLESPVALLLGAIAAATAPAATVVIVRELRARGPFVDYLYGIVAFDDAVSVILFGIVFAVISPILTGAAVAGGVLGSVLNALLELVGAVVLGFIGGLLVHLLTAKKHQTNEIMLIAVALLFLVTALASALRISLLIANMTMGCALVNLSSRNRRIFDIIEPLTPPIFALFFILAGTELDVAVFSRGFVVLIGLLYLASRFAGKVAGIQAAGLLTRTPARIRNFIGLCLFPQAGVAIGLALFVRTSPVMLNAEAHVQGMLSVGVNIVLLSVFVNELVGPIFSRFGIKKGTA